MALEPNDTNIGYLLRFPHCLIWVYPSTIMLSLLHKMILENAKTLTILLFYIHCVSSAYYQHYQVSTDEVFFIPLSNVFSNTTDADFLGNFLYSKGNSKYSAALHGLPDLPKWIQSVYNPLLQQGFLFGTPNIGLDSVKLDVIASNQVTFDTTAKEVLLEIYKNKEPTTSQISMKIHNINIEDLMDENVRNKLLDVFRTILWPESQFDLRLVELYSALTVGGRRPARRQDGEGVFLTIGSHSEFSDILRELEREVSPLWPVRNCPRDFKKTSAERFFRPKGFLVDWCSFKLTPQNVSLVPLSSTVSPELDTKTEKIVHHLNSLYPYNVESAVWNAPAKWETPRRSYVEEGVVAIFIPVVILLLLAALLTAVLGVHPEGGETEEGQLYEAMFEELNFLKTNTGAVVADKENTAGTTRPSKTPLVKEPNTPSLVRGKRNPISSTLHWNIKEVNKITS
nr:EOG090X04W0 [Macrothrix elegans]